MNRTPMMGGPGGNVGLLGHGPLVPGLAGSMSGLSGPTYSGNGYGRINKNNYQRSGYNTGASAGIGDQRDLASSVGLLVNLSQMLA